MESRVIEGVVVKELELHPDERGWLMEILRNDDPFFENFGQAYLTTTYPGVVKAWHYHMEQTDMIACLKGMIKLAIYDDREGSPTKGVMNEFFIGELSPRLVKVPKGLRHGWKCVSQETAFVLNCPDKTYDPKNPDEHRLDPNNNDIPYDWSRKDG